MRPLSGSTSHANHNYFELIDRVGSAGKYQWMIYCIALCTFLQVGLISFNEPFLFMNYTFDCSHL